jgi:hypothetical protein
MSYRDGKKLTAAARRRRFNEKQYHLALEFTKNG